MRALKKKVHEENKIRRSRSRIKKMSRKIQRLCPLKRERIQSKKTASSIADLNDTIDIVTAAASMPDSSMNVDFYRVIYDKTVRSVFIR